MKYQSKYRNAYLLLLVAHLLVTAYQDTLAEAGSMNPFFKIENMAAYTAILVISIFELVQIRRFYRERVDDAGLKTRKKETVFMCCFIILSAAALVVSF